MAKLTAISWPPHHLLVVEERAVRVHVGIVALLHDHRVGRDLRIRDFIVMDKTNTKDTAVQCSSLHAVQAPHVNLWEETERVLLGRPFRRGESTKVQGKNRKVMARAGARRSQTTTTTLYIGNFLATAATDEIALFFWRQCTARAGDCAHGRKPHSF